MSPRTESHRHASAAQEEAACASAGGAEGIDTSTVIFPRRKAGQNKRPSTQAPVVVTLEVLQEVFDMPLWKACKTLGICATAMKKVCRKLGVMEWPYKKNHMPGKRVKASAADQPATASPGDSSSTECEDADPISSSDMLDSEPAERMVRPLAAAAALRATREARTRAKAARSAEEARASPACKREAEEELERYEVMVVDASSSSESSAADDCECDAEIEECESPEDLVALEYYEPAQQDFLGGCFSSEGCSKLDEMKPAQGDGIRIALGEPVQEWGDLDGAWLRHPDLMSFNSFDGGINEDLELCLGA
mmetsp:Transcript_11230/g.27548  ORF Transcript_11230/g.27548 Transcript_11230/m.27548 type:complete len:309 (-) Transcript_11230:681-1607(-)